MHAGVQRLARAQAAQGPPEFGRGALRLLSLLLLQPLQQPAAELRLVGRLDAFERGRHAQQFVGRLHARAFGGGDVGGAGGLQVVGDDVMDHLLLFGVQAAGDAAPEGPPFGPLLAVVAVGDAGAEQFPHLLHAPAVERVAEAGAQGEADEVEPGAFVLGGAAAAFGALQQGAEKGAQ